MKKLILMLAAIVVAASSAMAQQAIFDPTAKKRAVADTTRTLKCDKPVRCARTAGNCDKAVVCTKDTAACCGKAVVCAGDSAVCRNKSVNCNNNTQCVNGSATCANSTQCVQTVETKSLNGEAEGSKPRSPKLKKASQTRNLEKVAVEKKTETVNKEKK